MSYHALIAFPDDDDETLEKVLRLTRTGAISSPLGRAITFEDVRDALLARMFGGKVIDDHTLMFEVADEEAAVEDWLVSNLPRDRYDRVVLEHFEFFRQTDAQRVVDAFRATTGRVPWLQLLGGDDWLRD